jgi:hypothetical protein
VVPEPPTAPRILPSIVEPLWSSSESVEPIHKRPSERATREQMELDLTTIASDDVKGGRSVMPVITQVLPQADIAPEEGAMSIYGFQSMQDERLKANLRKPRGCYGLHPSQVPESACSPFKVHSYSTLDPSRVTIRVAYVLVLAS